MRATFAIPALAAATAVALTVAGFAAPANAEDDVKRIVFMAGPASHGYEAHEHYAGCRLLADWLEESGLPVETEVFRHDWPEDPDAFDGADALVIFSNGGGGHPVLPHMDQVQELIDAGIGFGAIHYAVEVPIEYGDQFRNWLGGYFEVHWSVNPFWVAEYSEFPDHPVTNGVSPFEIEDEWYFNMRFSGRAVPILTDAPPSHTRTDRGDGPHSNNPFVRNNEGRPEHTAWVAEREDGGRSFGFTGAHWHRNWANPDFRTTVLNGVAWIAGLEVPDDGVPSWDLTVDDLRENQDYDEPDDFNWDHIEELIASWTE